MKIVIGRDATSGCLRIRRDNEKPQLIKGTEGTSPQVSKEHVELETQDGEHFILTNLNEDNVTYVDNVPVVRFALNRGIPIALGIERQPLLWKILDPYLPKYADIRPLKQLYDDYQAAMLDLQIRQQKAGAKRMLTPMFSITGSVLGGVFGQLIGGEDPKIRLILTVVFALPGLIVMLWFFIKGNKEAEFFPMERKRLETEFKARYVCPKCGTPFGMMDYTMLSLRQACGSCKAKFIT